MRILLLAFVLISLAGCEALGSAQDCGPWSVGDQAYLYAGDQFDGQPVTVMAPGVSVEQGRPRSEARFVWVVRLDRIGGYLGGPWAPSGGMLEIEFDIRQYFTGTLQREHTLTINCTGGQGEAVVTVELYEVIQSIGVL